MQDDKVDIRLTPLIGVFVAMLLIGGAIWAHRPKATKMAADDDLSWCSYVCRGHPQANYFDSGAPASVPFGWVTICRDGAFYDARDDCREHGGVETQDEVGGQSLPAGRQEMCACQDGALYSRDAK